MNRNQLTAYIYPKCGTCRNALKWLEANGITPQKVVNIVETPPSLEELRELWRKSGLPLRKFFNTSGEAYRKLQLKDKLPQMSEEEMLELLASDGKLIKRPILTDGEQAAVGFRDNEYEKLFS